MPATDRLSDGDLALREACRDSLVTFAEAFGPASYRAAKVHRYLARQLEACARRETRRLCISCPPRTGKSVLASVALPSWWLTNSPTSQVIQASYSAELAENFSRSTKALLAGEAYRELFPPILDPIAQAVKSWRTLRGGSYFATGVGGGATGRGADLLIVDDPIKNREEANSQLHRDRVWDWFMSMAMTRLSPNGVAVVIATRWHEDDLIGRLTNPERQRQFQDAGLGNEAFQFVRLEALCENPSTDPMKRPVGEALWPEVWPADRLEAVRIQIGPREFSALYQQRPAPAGGNLCDSSKIRVIEADQVPEGLNQFRAWDLALTTKELSDYSCGARGGMDCAGNFYLTHVHRGKRVWSDQKRLIVDLAAAESTGSRIGIENVGAFSVAESELRTALGGRVRVEGFRPSSDKVTRATPWLAKIDAGMFHMVRGGWNADFRAELEQLPTGQHDDQIDAVSILFQMVTQPHQVLVMA